MTLRPLELSDVSAWFEFAADPRVLLHTSAQVTQAADLLPIIERGLSTESGTPIHFAVCGSPDQRLIGVAGFHSISVLNKTAEITYTIHPAHWGRGFASAVCGATTRWGFEQHGFVRIQATVLPPNRASILVLERNGFLLEGIIRHFRIVRGEPRDYLMYSRLPADADPLDHD
ncbi:GNAT family N-acetyltransferase [Piscinibacter terrae]|uniref:GNAT family N-acetyltransferase n=1 Tax=Piscinibacter terrae TaxID=2496871 RepID=UPI0013874B24|nr:GNAT family protein [Albitalea terrae]